MPGGTCTSCLTHPVLEQNRSTSVAFAVQVQEGRDPQTAWRAVLLGLAPPRIYFGAWPASRECEKSRAVRRGQGHGSRRRGGAVRATSGWARPSPSRLVAPEPVGRAPCTLCGSSCVQSAVCKSFRAEACVLGPEGRRCPWALEHRQDLPRQDAQDADPGPAQSPGPALLASARVTCRPHSSPVKRVGTSSCGSQDMLPCGPLPLLPWCCSVLDIHDLGL